MLAVMIVAAAGLLVSSTLFTASLRLQSPVQATLALWLLATAQIVLMTEILSPFHLVRGWGYGVLQAVLVGGATAVWLRRGRPRLPSLPRAPLLPAALEHPVITVLLLVVLAAIGYEAFIVVATPPNNWDSMTYHLSRAAGWLQHHGVEYLPAHTERQNAFQPNAEILILWTFSFLSRDTLAAAPQLLAQVVLMTGIYGIGRRIGFSRPASLLPALVAATLTEISLQAVTTQNDLVAASFVLAATYFALGRTRIELLLACTAVGLALGTKLTSAFALPIIVLVYLSRRPRAEWLPSLARAVPPALAAFVAFGLYGYALNIAETGHILGDPSASEALKPTVTGAGTISSIARLTWRMVDLSGLPRDEGLSSGIGDAGQTIFDALGIRPNPDESTTTAFGFTPNSPANEDMSFFGPLGVLLILPVSLGALLAWLAGGRTFRRRHGAVGALGLALPVFVVLLSLAYRYNVWIGRFMIVPVALTLPLTGVIYGLRWRIVRPLAIAVSAVGVWCLYAAQAHNHAKPTGIGGGPAVWEMSRLDAQAVTRPAMHDALVGIQEHVPLGKSVGILFGEDDWDYPLYGPHLDRRLVKLPAAAPDLLAAAERMHVHWVVVSYFGATPPGGRQWSESRRQWYSFRYWEAPWTLYLRPEEFG